MVMNRHLLHSWHCCLFYLPTILDYDNWKRQLDSISIKLTFIQYLCCYLVRNVSEAGCYWRACHASHSFPAALFAPSLQLPRHVLLTSIIVWEYRVCINTCTICGQQCHTCHGSKSAFSSLQDMVNRRISMDMMLAVARNQTDRQFIFLTPQDMR